MIFASLEKEEFRFVTNGYLISNMGRFYSIKNKIFLGGQVDKLGYHRYHYSVSGIRIHCFSHRLVAMNFIPNDDERKIQVNHINNNKLDNRAENLEWMTCAENISHFHKTDPRSKINIDRLNTYVKSGEDVHWSKLTEDNVREIKILSKNGIKGTVIAEKFKVTSATIYAILKNKSWKHVI